MTDVRIRRMCRSSLLVLLGGMLLATTAFAQSYPASLYEGMRWRLVGPFRGGRAEAATGIPGDPNTYYFGAAAGGVWKTTDAGLTWTPIFDREPNSSIGAIAVAPSNHDIIYVGTGEQCLRNDITFGNGVYKSTDAGKTWTNIGLRDTQHIATILVNPTDPNNVYVAAIGHAFGPNSERGVFHSTDGGATWQKILYVDDKTGATDLVADPKNPQVMFAAMYEVRRTAYSMISGGPGSGLYKSTDGGANWRRLEGHGLPGGILGRIGIAISGADSNRVYAIVEAKVNAIYSSDDSGENWKMVNDEPLWVRPWYQNHIYADPKNVDTIYSLDVGLFRSTGGGHTFETLPLNHTDNHQLWIDPTNPQRMIEADDG
ncbi:MAG: WD40/YVTN/BNR-like repeat-containing protein, partial [Candidatus Acidiferrales bacterium]